MNLELIEKAKRLALDDTLPDDVRETLNLLASAYRDRCVSLEKLTNALGDIYEFERRARDSEDRSGI